MKTHEELERDKLELEVETLRKERDKIDLEVQGLKDDRATPKWARRAALVGGVASTLVSLVLSVIVLAQGFIKDWGEQRTEDRATLERYLEWATDGSHPERQHAGAIALASRWGAGWDPLLAPTLSTLLLSDNANARFAAALSLGAAMQKETECTPKSDKIRLLLFGDGGTGQWGTVTRVTLRLNQMPGRPKLSGCTGFDMGAIRACVQRLRYHVRRGGLKDAEPAQQEALRWQGFASEISEAVSNNSACLEGAHLRNAPLTGARLHRAHLKRALLADADLCGANLAGADLSESRIMEAGALALTNLGQGDSAATGLSQEEMERALDCGAVQMPLGHRGAWDLWSSAGYPVPDDEATWARWRAGGFKVGNDGHPEVPAPPTNVGTSQETPP